MIEAYQVSAVPAMLPSPPSPYMVEVRRFSEYEGGAWAPFTLPLAGSCIPALCAAGQPSHVYHLPVSSLCPPPSPYSQGLPAPSQRLLLRLFLRKGPWFQVCAEGGAAMRRRRM